MTLTAAVTALEQLTVPIGGYLDSARQLFLLACYTGLRFSDLVSTLRQSICGAKCCV
jgi:hypothetical protein